MTPGLVNRGHAPKPDEYANIQLPMPKITALYGNTGFRPAARVWLGWIAITAHRLVRAIDINDFGAVRYIHVAACHDGFAF